VSAAGGPSGAAGAFETPLLWSGYHEMTVLAGPAIFSGLLSSWAAADNEQMSDRFFGLLPGGAVEVAFVVMVLPGAADGEPIMVRPFGLPR